MTRDIDAGTNVQIRDESHPVVTPSLQQAGDEVVPDELVRDLLAREWFDRGNCPRPGLFIRNERYQENISRDDVVVIEQGPERETFNGHRHEFVNVEVPISLEVHTTHSRARLHNIKAEIRRIIYEWILALQPFHSLYYDGFSVDYTSGTNRHVGTVNLRLTADALPAFARRVTGEESPSTDPGFFPDSIPV